MTKTANEKELIKQQLKNKTLTNSIRFDNVTLNSEEIKFLIDTIKCLDGAKGLLKKILDKYKG